MRAGRGGGRWQKRSAGKLQSLGETRTGACPSPTDFQKFSIYFPIARGNGVLLFCAEKFSFCFSDEWSLIAGLVLGKTRPRTKKNKKDLS
jgi:hypothetical protein